MPYIKQLILEHRSLWEQAVHHQLKVDMCEDTLPMDRFGEYMVQHRFLTIEGVRMLLCRLLADCRPEQSTAASILRHIESVQPGGDNYEVMSEMVAGSGCRGDPEALPATQALCDYLSQIGSNFSVHEKVLALVTLVELSNARFEFVATLGKAPKTPIFAQWLSSRNFLLLKPRLEWLHTALDATRPATVCDSDRFMFCRIVQWVVLMNDSVRDRGTWEWPGAHYYHPRRLPGASV